MPDAYHVQCDCGSVKLTLKGQPRVRGFCHCEDCRDLLKVPYHSVTAWERDAITFESGEGLVVEFQHPTKRMTRVFCSDCGETLFNTNAMDWRIVSQLLIRKCYDDVLPEQLRSQLHFFYGRRIVDIDDDLPIRRWRLRGWCLGQPGRPVAIPARVAESLSRRFGKKKPPGRPCARSRNSESPGHVCRRGKPQRKASRPQTRPLDHPARECVSGTFILSPSFGALVRPRETFAANGLE